MWWPKDRNGLFTFVHYSVCFVFDVFLSIDPRISELPLLSFWSSSDADYSDAFSHHALCKLLSVLSLLTAVESTIPTLCVTSFVQENCEVRKQNKERRGEEIRWRNWIFRCDPSVIITSLARACPHTHRDCFFFVRLLLLCFFSSHSVFFVFACCSLSSLPLSSILVHLLNLDIARQFPALSLAAVHCLFVWTLHHQVR